MGEQISIPFVAGSKTSRAAAKSVERTLARHEQLVFDVIRSAGDAGATDDEIEKATGLRHQTASARRRGLVLRGVVVPDGERTRKTRSGRQAQVWKAAK